MEIKLNLIPQEKKEELMRTKQLHLILRWGINTTFVLLIFYVLLISLNYLLKINAEVQKNEAASVQNKTRYERISELDNEFKEINTQISLNKLIQSDQLYWSRMFIKLNDAMPEGISITKMANNNYRFMLVGIADTRDSLVAMKDNLSQDNCFIDVSLPLSSLVYKENVDFQLEFNIKEECIKNK